MMAFKLEELSIWHSALDISHAMHNLSLTFPKDDRFFLGSQIKQAADAIALNISEASTSQSHKEFNRFPGIAHRSAIDVVACLHFAKTPGYIVRTRQPKCKETVERLTISIQSFFEKIMNEA
jgi:four helix bundle protein